MMKPEKPLYVVDVDLTIVDHFEFHSELIEGSEELLGVFASLGEAHLWSAGGKAYCRQVAEDFRLEHLISEYHDKPEYPPTEEGALLILGRVAVLQIDDDISERIPGWNFLGPSEARRLYIGH